MPKASTCRPNHRERAGIAKTSPASRYGGTWSCGTAPVKTTRCETPSARRHPAQPRPVRPVADDEQPGVREDLRAPPATAPAACPGPCGAPAVTRTRRPARARACPSDAGPRLPHSRGGSATGRPRWGSDGTSRGPPGSEPARCGPGSTHSRRSGRPLRRRCDASAAGCPATRPTRPRGRASAPGRARPPQLAAPAPSRPSGALAPKTTRSHP